MSDGLDQIAKDVENGVLTPMKPTFLEYLLNRQNRFTQGFLFLLMVLMIVSVVLTPTQSVETHLPLVGFLCIVVCGIYYVQRSLPIVLKPRRQLFNRKVNGQNGTTSS